MSIVIWFVDDDILVIFVSTDGHFCHHMKGEAPKVPRGGLMLMELISIYNFDAEIIDHNGIRICLLLSEDLGTIAMKQNTHSSNS